MSKFYKNKCFFFFAGVTIHGLFRKVSTTDFNANQIKSFTFGTVHVFSEWFQAPKFTALMYPYFFMAYKLLPIPFMARKKSDWEIWWLNEYVLNILETTLLCQVFGYRSSKYSGLIIVRRLLISVHKWLTPMNSGPNMLPS